MKKNILLLLVIFIISTLNIPTFANENIEIEFSVGDEILLINQTPVTVVKPYVVGEGVTLVPVRVIAEAFEADVGWVEESETVTLEYKDINIILQIGNITAIVNGKEETLLSAPELTNSSTMVPLRFISEKFGATVFYNEETEKITVVKENETSFSDDIEAMKKYVNDELGFSIYIPKDLTYSSYSNENIIRFYENDEYNEEYMLEFGIYHKEIGNDAEKTLNKHREKAAKYFKESSIKNMYLVKERQYDNLNAFNYCYELYYSNTVINGIAASFEENDCIFVIDSRNVSEEMLKNIICSIETKNINKEKTVNFKFNKENITFQYDKTLTDIQITLPNTYKKTENKAYDRFEFEEYAEYVRIPGNVLLRCMVITKRGNSGHYIASEFRGDNLIKIDFKGKLESCGEYRDVLLGDVHYVEVDYVINENKKRIYCEEYIILKDGIEYRFVVNYPELYYSEEIKQEIYNALGRI